MPILAKVIQECRADISKGSHVALSRGSNQVPAEIAPGPQTVHSSHRSGSPPFHNMLRIIPARGLWIFQVRRNQKWAPQRDAHKIVNQKPKLRPDRPRRHLSVCRRRVQNPTHAPHGFYPRFRSQSTDFPSGRFLNSHAPARSAHHHS